jgi:hypothetical protein
MGQLHGAVFWFVATAAGDFLVAMGVAGLAVSCRGIAVVQGKGVAGE